MTFVKHDAGKPRMELVPARAHLEVAKVLTFGANKYTQRDDEGTVLKDGANNWRLGGVAVIPRYLGAAERHINALKRGETRDEESGLPHLAHALTCLLFALELDLLHDEEVAALVRAGEAAP